VETIAAGQSQYLFNMDAVEPGKPKRFNLKSFRVSGVERKDQTTDKAADEPYEGRRPRQQGRVNEQPSDGEQKV
jgi:hypothetical protein